MRNYVVVAALLLAAPLAAQQQTLTVVPDVEITVNGDTIVVNVEVMSDSVRLARIAIAVESIAAALEECGCMEPQGQTVAVVRYGVPVVALVFGLLGLRRLTQIADAINKEHVPEEPEETEDDDDSESYP